MNVLVKTTVQRLEDSVSTHTGVISVPARKVSRAMANDAQVSHSGFRVIMQINSGK